MTLIEGKLEEGSQEDASQHTIMVQMDIHFNVELGEEIRSVVVTPINNLTASETFELSLLTTIDRKQGIFHAYQMFNQDGSREDIEIQSNGGGLERELRSSLLSNRTLQQIIEKKLNEYAKEHPENYQEVEEFKKLKLVTTTYRKSELRAQRGWDADKAIACYQILWVLNAGCILEFEPI
ncbi:MAG: hypothetical protein WAX66_01930 [Patescibacteria group bacterium]